MPKYERTMIERLRHAEDQIQKLWAANSRREPLNRLAAGDFIIEDGGTFKTSDFDGTDSAHPGSHGVYIASEDGVGKLVVNDITLRGGIIGNDALANPVTFDQSGDYTNTIAFGTSSATVTSCTITVPAGFTKCMLMTSAIVQGTNIGGAADNLWCQIVVPGVGFSASMFMGVAAGFSTACWNYYNVQVPGLTGGQVLTIQVRGWTQANAWGAGSNSATVNAAAVFRR